jgi:uncharacterized membrane protein YhaH (DUF805 family)
MKNKKIWFRRKIYGWGWYPSTWEGWLVILAWVAIFIPIVSLMREDSILKFILIILITALLIFICYKKGEKPKWQWGKDDEKV